MSERVHPGTETWIGSDSPSSQFSSVFEDDGEMAYFYAYDRGTSESAILDAVHIYNVANVVDRDVECEVEIIWSQDGLKAGRLLNAQLHAVLDFHSGKAYCRNNFPAPGGRWAAPERSAWSDQLAKLFQSSGAG